MDLTCLKKKSQIHPSVFIARGVQIIGDVQLSRDASIWYNSVLRADIQPISIGERTNIQDGSILHVDHALPCIIGNDVTVGHHVNLHGCTVEDCCLIGMGAIILSGAHIKKGCIIAAGSVVKEGSVVEERSLMAGVPAKKIKELPDGIFQLHLQHASEYIALARAHKEFYNG